jgi:hypothetical protein
VPQSGSISFPRSSNRTCGFPASGFPTGFIAGIRQIVDTSVIRIPAPPCVVQAPASQGAVGGWRAVPGHRHRLRQGVSGHAGGYSSNSRLTCAASANSKASRPPRSAASTRAAGRASTRPRSGGWANRRSWSPRPLPSGSHWAGQRLPGARNAGAGGIATDRADRRLPQRNSLRLRPRVVVPDPAGTPPSRDEPNGWRHNPRQPAIG